MRLVVLSGQASEPQAPPSLFSIESRLCWAQYEGLKKLGMVAYTFDPNNQEKEAADLGL